MEGQKTQNSQHNIEGEEQIWRIDKTRLQNYYKAAIIKTVLLTQDRQIDGWNRIKGPETDQIIHGQLIFDKTAKAIQWERILNNCCQDN